MKNLKRVVTIFFLLATFIYSCKKDNNNVQENDNNVQKDNFKCINDSEKKWQSIDEVKELFKKLNVRYVGKKSFSKDCEHFKNIKVNEQTDIKINYPFCEEEIHKITNFIKNEYRAPIYVRWINKTVGYGVFADKNFKKGDYLCQYTGIVTKSPSDTNYAWAYPLGIDSSQYSNFIQKGYSQYALDAKQYGNEGRFVNDPLNDNAVNVIAKSFYIDNQFYIIYIAKKNINKNEQLFVSYGQNYWKNRKGEKLE